MQQAEDFSLIRSYRRVDVIVIKLLSWLAKKFGRDVETGHLPDLRLTYQEMAEMLLIQAIVSQQAIVQLLAKHDRHPLIALH